MASAATTINAGSDVDEQLGESSSGSTNAAPKPVNDGSKVYCEDFGLDDLLADDTELQQSALNLAEHYEGLDKYGRRSEVIEARRQRFYRRGDQYIYFNFQPSICNFVPYSSGDDNGAPGSDSARNMEVYNIYWAYMRALVSVGTQNPPGVAFEPDDPMKATDIGAARAAEIFRHHVDRVNKRKKIQSDVMGNFCTDGRTVLYTRTVRDKQKFGIDDETKEPKGVELVSVFGVLEHKATPITEDDPTNWLAQSLSKEIDVNLAKAMKPEYAASIKPSSDEMGESTYERMARIGVLQGTRSLQNAGDAFAHLVTWKRIFLRPSAFRHCSDAVREKFEEAFPDGMKLVTMGGAYCGAYNVSADDHLSVGWPAPGDGAAKPSMLKDLVPVQDAYNDYRNLEKEIFDFCIPATWCDSELGDPEVLREQTSEPGNHVFATRPANAGSFAEAFFTEPPANAPASMVAAYQDLRGAFAQFVTGAQPALFGGSDKNNETLGGIAILRDQAMGQFSVAWGALQELFAGSYKQAVQCRAKAAKQDSEAVLNVKVPGKRVTTVSKVSIDALQKGNFHTYPDLDSSFPETTGSKRQTMQALVTQALTDPVATEAYGILEPENLELQREYSGLSDWVIPSANSNVKQLGEIELLLRARPVPKPGAIQKFAADQALEQAAKQKLAAAVPGAPIEPPEQPDPNVMYEPTIKVDVNWDFHEFEYKTIKDWLSSPEGIEEALTNKWGVLNVKLHGDEHKLAMGMQAAGLGAPGAPGPGGPGAGAPPGPPAPGNAPGAAGALPGPGPTAMPPPPGPMNQPQASL